MTERKYCNKPDRHVPSLKCGHPLPCPYHTVVIEKGKVSSPTKLDKKTSKRVQDIADALKDL